MNITITDLVLLATGTLVIIFRKQYAGFVMRYHRKRLQRMKKTKAKLQKYPEEVQSKAWSVANRYTEIMSIIIGAFFVIMSILSMLGILERKP